QRSDALAAAGLADDAERAPAPDREADAVHRPEFPAVAGEIRAKLLDLEQGAHCGAFAVASAIAASITVRSNTPDGESRRGRNLAKWTNRSRLFASSLRSSTSGSAW